MTCGVTSIRLVICADDWGRSPTSGEHLVGQLLACYSTVWVNTIGTWRLTASMWDLAKVLLFGRFLSSLPYLNRGGVVADDAFTATALIRRDVALGEQLNVRYMELRHSDPFQHASLPEYRHEKVRMVLDLPDSAAVL